MAKLNGLNFRKEILSNFPQNVLLYYGRLKSELFRKSWKDCKTDFGGLNVVS